MAPINVTNVEVLDNPSLFTNPFQFQITFECIPPGVKEGASPTIQSRRHLNPCPFSQIQRFRCFGRPYLKFINWFCFALVSFPRRYDFRFDCAAP